MDYLKYNSDSGNRDLSTEKRYNKDIPFEEIYKLAKELKAPLIVKTSYVNEKKPGAWYIKGFANKQGISKKSYEEIKFMIEDNKKNKKHTKRTCYLIKY